MKSGGRMSGQRVAGLTMQPRTYYTGMPVQSLNAILFTMRGRRNELAQSRRDQLLLGNMAQVRSLERDMQALDDQIRMVDEVRQESG